LVLLTEKDECAIHGRGRELACSPLKSRNTAVAQDRHRLRPGKVPLSVRRENRHCLVAWKGMDEHGSHSQLSVSGAKEESCLFTRNNQVLLIWGGDLRKGFPRWALRRGLGTEKDGNHCTSMKSEEDLCARGIASQRIAGKGSSIGLRRERGTPFSC